MKKIKVDRCFNCPFCHESSHITDMRQGRWFICPVGGTLPSFAYLIDMELPADCPLPITIVKVDE